MALVGLVSALLYITSLLMTLWHGFGRSSLSFTIYYWPFNDFM